MVDDDIYELYGGVKWQAVKSGSQRGLYYAVRTTTAGQAGKYVVQLLHRLILGAPKGMLADHIDGNTLDCRRQNLRLVNAQQSQQNRSKNKKHNLPKGIRIIRGKFHARIRTNKQEYSLGSYEKLEDAVRAYNKKAKELFGEYAGLSHI